MAASNATPWASNSVIGNADEDCKDLIDEFCRKPTIRFGEFVQVWNERKFDTIYFGRESFIDLLEFTEGLLAIAKGFCLPPHSTQVRIGGVYLMYSLYYVQPLKDDDVPHVKIRVTKEEWDSLEELKEACLSEQQLEVFYILNKMLCDGAFHFTTAQWPFCVSKLHRQYLDKRTSDTQGPDLISLKDGKCVAALQEAYELYGRLKQRLPEAESATANDRDANFAEVLKSTLESFGKSNIKPS